jgi:hypothetical protein
MNFPSFLKNVRDNDINGPTDFLVVRVQAQTMIFKCKFAEQN